MSEVSKVFRALPTADQGRAVILASNYAETCSMNHYGRALRLPNVYSGHNSCWDWAGDGLTTDVAITVGYKEKFLRKVFGRIERVATFSHPYVMAWENEQPIFVCRDPVEPLEKAWPRFRDLM